MQLLQGTSTALISTDSKNAFISLDGWLMDINGLSINSSPCKAFQQCDVSSQYTCLPGQVRKSFPNLTETSGSSLLARRWASFSGVFPKAVDQHMSSASVQAPILWPCLPHNHNPKENCCQVTSSSNMRSNSMIVILRCPTTVSSSWGEVKQKKSTKSESVLASAHL